MRNLFFTTAWILLFVPLFSAEARKKTRKPTNVPPSGPSFSVPSSALQKILTAEDQRLQDPFLVSSLNNSSPRIARAALIALGRIGDPAALEPIVRILNRKDREMKKTAAFALGLIQDPTALKMLVQNVPMQKDPEVIAALLVSVGRSGIEQSVNTVADALKEGADKKVVEAACHALGTLWSGGSEKWAVPPGLLAQLAKYSQEPGDVGLKAAFALARYKGDSAALPGEEILKAAQAVTNSETRALLCRALGKVKSTGAAHFLAQQLINDSNLGTRIESAKSLSQQVITDEVVGAYKKALGDTSSALVVQTLESIGLHGTAAMTPLTESVETVFRTNASIWVKGSALKNLSRINPIVGRQKVSEVLKAPSSPLLPTAVASLGILGTGEDIEKLTGYVSHPEIRVSSEAIEALSPFPEEKYTAALKAALKQALERADTATSALAAQIAEKFKWKEFATSIVSVYPLFSAPDQVEAKVALMNALGAIGDRSHLPLVEEALKEPEKLVVAAAANAYKSLTGKEPTVKVPLNSKVIATPPALAEAQAATNARVVLNTTRGEIHMRMVDDAPLNALNFIRLVKQGALKQTFYDGKTFHRVVPNFVVQGGDPRGDGYGGPGYLVRDEVSNRIHRRGTVGIATAGKDTGGCQFFINLAPNLHLDGRYTLFAEVTKGMDVADKLEVGDRIISAKLIK